MIAPEIIEQYRALTTAKGLPDFELDDRPWGGEFIYDDALTEQFIKAFFPERVSEAAYFMRPKFLIVAPHQRFSWQYHKLRGEVWKVLGGPLGAVISPTDDQPEPKVYQVGDEIEAKVGERHRMVGLDDWGVVAELWRNADPKNPSYEEDNIRLEDDYKRA